VSTMDRTRSFAGCGGLLGLLTIAAALGGSSVNAAMTVTGLKTECVSPFICSHAVKPGHSSTVSPMQCRVLMARAWAQPPVHSDAPRPAAQPGSVEKMNGLRGLCSRLCHCACVAPPCSHWGQCMPQWDWSRMTFYMHAAPLAPTARSAYGPCASPHPQEGPLVSRRRNVHARSQYMAPTTPLLLRCSALARSGTSPTLLDWTSQHRASSGSLPTAHAGCFRPAIGSLLARMQPTDPCGTLAW
jgi:hypothetical protein